MFKLARRNEVLWPVIIQVPVDHGTSPVEIDIRYRLLSRSEARTLEERTRTDGTDAFSALDALDTELASRITGWDRVGDEDGKPAPFSPEALRALLDLPYAYTAIRDGLFNASNGALAKN